LKDAAAAQDDGSKAEPETPKKLKRRKRKRLISDVDEFELDLKEAKRLSKLLAREQNNKKIGADGNKPGTNAIKPFSPSSSIS